MLPSWCMSLCLWYFLLLLTALDEKMGCKLHELIYKGLVTWLVTLFFFTNFSASWHYRHVHNMIASWKTRCTLHLQRYHLHWLIPGKSEDFTNSWHSTCMVWLHTEQSTRYITIEYLSKWYGIFCRPLRTTLALRILSSFQMLRAWNSQSMEWHLTPIVWNIQFV